MAETEIPEQLWEEFHTVVNMTSRELQEWLRTRSSLEGAEVPPEETGGQLGRKVLRILRKRRTDLTKEDAAVMDEVVEKVSAQRNAELDPKAGDTKWRQRLMDVGHDPLKPG